MNIALLTLFVYAIRPAVELQNHDHRWQLLVAGKPFIVKGAGGDASKAMLAEMGGNSFRTWGADNLDKQLSEAQGKGLRVTVGIWLGHKEHGFRYDDPNQVTKQFNDAKAVIQKYKDNPAVLMWALGNEMEGYDKGDDPNVWMAIEDLAHMAHQVDPNHPTMSVIAEIGGNRVAAINKMCPSLDIVGINSYAGAPSLYSRYLKQGGTKPYILTEFGPPGAWECASTPWQRPIEPSSTAKESSYELAY
jgi:beta-galactosidase/beta-glucuronidase